MPRHKLFSSEPTEETNTAPAPRKAGGAMVTWLGEDHLHEGENGPRTNTWNGVTFKKGEAVEVSDPKMIAKAKANHFYEVDGERAPAPIED